MNKILMLVCLIIGQCSSINAQTNKVDSLNFYINKLNWSSFGINCQYVLMLDLADDARKIIALPNKEKTKLLLRHIEDSTKTVIIHVLLTELLEPNKSLLSYRYNYQGKEITGITFSYNGISWSDTDGKKPTIDRNNIITAKQYWVGKFLKKQINRNVNYL